VPTGDPLHGEKFICFSTLRRNGAWVDTPVWFAPGDGCYYVFSAGNAGKVKRLRNFSQCRVAPCTFSGKLKGDWRDGNACLLEDPQEQQRAHRALRRKYGLQMLATDIGAKLAGRYKRRQFIRFSLD